MESQDKNFFKWLRREWAFLAIVVTFAAETVWLAITSNFPMAFDEGWHFGIIQFFSHHISPIVTRQPADTYYLGALPHNPSLFYHYLLSFPYRLITLFSHSLRAEVIGLRLINVVFAVVSLILIKQILRRLKLPNIVANLTVLVFAFTPMFSALSAQINYDNLTILSTAGGVLLTIKFIERLKQGRVDLWILAGQWCLLLFASLVKFAFPPIMVGILVVEVIYAWLYRKRGLDWRLAYRQLQRWQLAVLAVGGLTGLSLFAMVYGEDLVLYKNPNPPCNQILSVSACTQYYSWDRNYTLATHKDPGAPMMNVVSYSILWSKEIYYQLFAEIVPDGGMVPVDKPFFILLLTFTAMALTCTLSQLRYILRRHHMLPVVLIISLAYVIALWGRNYNDYRHLGQAVAIQGRYLLPVLLYAYAVLALGVWYSLSRPSRIVTASRVLLGVELVVVFLYFGGFSSYKTNISPLTQWHQPQHNVAAIINAKTNRLAN